MRERLLYELARRQHGVFTRAQAKECGFSNRMIQYRLESGIWIQLHPTVYCLGATPPTWERDQLAACLWSSGPAAGVAAGHLHQLPGCEESPIEVVTRVRQRAMPMSGVIVHATNRLPVEQICVVNSIPVTAIERTLLDLCGQMPRRAAAIALDNALSRGLTSLGQLDYCLYMTARRGRNGSGRLRNFIRERAEIGQTPTSPLETVVLQMFIDCGLPMPQLQHRIFDEGGEFVARVDFCYPESKLIIEAHSRLWHEGKHAQLVDSRREERLRALGFEVLYVTWADATQYKDRTAAQIARRLGGVSTHLRDSERARLLLS